MHDLLLPRTAPHLQLPSLAHLLQLPLLSPGESTGTTLPIRPPHSSPGTEAGPTSQPSIALATQVIVADLATVIVDTALPEMVPVCPLLPLKRAGLPITGPGLVFLQHPHLFGYHQQGVAVTTLNNVSLTLCLLPRHDAN